MPTPPRAYPLYYRIVEIGTYHNRYYADFLANLAVFVKMLKGMS